jgi:hypothetical protein
MNEKMPARLPLVRVDKKTNRKKCGAGGGHDKKKNQEAAEILLLRYFAYFAVRCRQNYRPIKRKDNDSDCIPTCNCRTPESKMSSHGKEHRRTGGQSQAEAMPGVLPRNKIDKAHVSGWLSLLRTRDIPSGPIRNA